MKISVNKYVIKNPFKKKVFVHMFMHKGFEAYTCVHQNVDIYQALKVLKSFFFWKRLLVNHFDCFYSFPIFKDPN